MKTLRHLFENNVEWAKRIKEDNPDFFSLSAQQQTPNYLWIGCSDSRVPANQILDLPPGEIFVHRNIANLVIENDLNCLSVLQYAVDVLKIKHIIVCGHYGCGGVAAALSGQKLGLIDNWLHHIKETAQLYTDKLEGLEPQKKSDLLCELNVIQQVANVCNTEIVQDAWKSGAELSVHSWIYSLENGIIHDLDSSISSLGELEKFRS